MTSDKSYVVDSTISELEQNLDPAKFIRIHRSTLLNLDHVQEVHSWSAGGVIVRLKDEKRTELPVARDRVRALKQRLGFQAHQRNPGSTVDGCSFNMTPEDFE